MGATIELQDVGPIERLEIPVPAGGGVVVLRGLNGSGKSHALAAVGALLEGDGRPTTRDGSLGAQVRGLGARLTVGRRTSVSGEIEVAHLDGEDPSLLVDPGIKSDEAADAARLRALLRLSGSKVDASAFASLVGGDEALREICRPASLTGTGDVPAMAAAIKRDIEAAARKAEATAENLAGKAAGVRATLVELDGEGDVATETGSALDARAAHTKAVRAHAALEQSRAEGAKLAEAAARARSVIDSLGTAGTEQAIEAAQAAVKTTRDRGEALHEKIEALKVELAGLQSGMEAARGEYRAAMAAADRQLKDAAARRELTATIEAAAAAPEVTDEAIEQRALEVAAASVEIERWAVRDRTAHVRAELADLEKRSLEAAGQGATLRAAAQGTERVVLDAVRAVCVDGLELAEGRLYMRTDRGAELFSDLSHGERWRIALDIAVKAVGSSGILVCRQEAYESLDPDNRRAVAEHARARGVVILTAEAAEGEIRAEVYEAPAT